MDQLEILQKYFGYQSFRKGQESLISSILRGQDVLGIMPTGAGKSICYQVPALMMEGITIVVSPLISLMKDQVTALNQAGIHAAYINGSLTERQIELALRNAKNGQYKIIYVAPERLETYGFLDMAVNSNISMVTVDEAHCISQWGQDFRPSYLKIIDFISKLPKRPVISAFTATATQQVKEDMICILGLEEEGYISKKQLGIAQSREVTEQGSNFGIRREWLISQRGTGYEVYHLSKFAQRGIVRKLIQE